MAAVRATTPSPWSYPCAIGLDLAPWIDAPPAIRWRHSTEAARSFRGALDKDQRRGGGET